MANFADAFKKFLADSAKAVNKAATNVAGATRYKMSEMDGISRRKEAIAELGEKVYGLFTAGVELPEEIIPLVNEIRALDEELDNLRSERAATKAAAAEERAAEKVARAEERAAAKAARAAEKAAAAEAKAAAAAAAEEAATETVAAEEEATDVESSVPVIDYEPEMDSELEYTGEAPVLEVAEEDPEKTEQ